jgi:hypothetical protein
MSALNLPDPLLRALRRIVRLVDTPAEHVEANVTPTQVQQIKTAINTVLMPPVPPPPPPPPTVSVNCLGGRATTFRSFYADRFTGGEFWEADILGGQSPDGQGDHMGLSYWFLGLSGEKRSVWAPRYADNHSVHTPTETTLAAALAAVNGVRYFQMGEADALDGGCHVYEAGQADFPAPGPNYRRVGTSGTLGIPTYSLGAGLPIYARPDANPKLVAFALWLTGGAA